MHASDDALLERLQRNAFEYFRRNANPVNGLIADTTRPGAPASIAVVGFALSAYPVGVELERHNCLDYSRFGTQGEWRLQGHEGR